MLDVALFNTETHFESFVVAHMIQYKKLQEEKGAKGDGYDYFSDLLNHARVSIDNLLRNRLNRWPPEAYRNKYRVLSKAISGPITFNKAYIEDNFISVHFYSEADIDVVNSYDYKKYVGSTTYDGVDLEVTYHISELLIKNNKLHIINTINTRSDMPCLNASSGRIHIFNNQFEISEKMFFVLSGNVRNSTVKRVSLYGGDDINVDWEVANKENHDLLIR